MIPRDWTLTDRADAAEAEADRKWYMLPVFDVVYFDGRYEVDASDEDGLE